MLFWTEGRVLSHRIDTTPTRHVAEAYNWNMATPDGQLAWREYYYDLNVRLALSGDDRLVVIGDCHGEESIASFLYIMDLLTGQTLWTRDPLVASRPLSLYLTTNHHPGGVKGRVVYQSPRHQTRPHFLFRRRRFQRRDRLPPVRLQRNGNPDQGGLGWL